MAFSARITENEFNPQEETFEPTCVYIFLSQKPSGKDLLLLPLPCRFFFTLLTLSFFPILYVLTLAKHRAVIVKQCVYTLPKLFPSHIIILSHIVISNPSSSPSSTSSVGVDDGLVNSITAPTAPPMRAPATEPAFLASLCRFSSSDSSPSSNRLVRFPSPRAPIRATPILSGEL